MDFGTKLPRFKPSPRPNSCVTLASQSVWVLDSLSVKMRIMIVSGCLCCYRIMIPKNGAWHTLNAPRC